MILNNIDKAQQLLLYDDMQWGTMSPTDIDAYMDLRGTNVFYEAKFRDSLIPYGQRLALEHLIRMARKAGEKACLISVSHNIKDFRQPIKLGGCIVTRIYDSERLEWWEPKRLWTAHDYTDRIIEKARRER